MRFGSCCSGIEAASVAWAPLGWEAAWLAEVDVAASQVLSYRLGATAPKTPLPGTEKAIARLTWGDRLTNYGDMTTLPALVRAGEAEAPDILCGGTPCQSWSVAGARKGLADPRGGLTLSFVQLADAIDDVRLARGDEPAIIIWENVPGILSDKNNGFGCFLAALAGEDVPLVPAGKRWADAGVVLGPQRAIAWRVQNAEFFQLAQRRRRVFVVASAREGFDPAAILLEFDGVRRDSPPSREAGEGVTHPTAPCLTGSGRGVERTGDPRGQDPVVACRRPGPDGTSGLTWSPDVAGTLKSCGGKSGTPNGAEEADRLVIQAEPTWWDGSPVSQTLDAVLHKGQTMPEKNRFPAVLQPVAQSVALRGRDGGATAELGDETAYALRAAAGGGSDPYVLAPVTAFQTRGSNLDIDDHVTGTIGSNCDRASGSAPMIIFSCKDHGGDATQDISPTMRAMGHASSHANAGGQIAVCVTGSVTHTLKAEGFDASEDGTGRGQPIVPATPFNLMPDRRDGATVALPTAISMALTAKGEAAKNGRGLHIATTMAVRRLMPVECHKLQGFPPDWCAVPIGPKGKIAADGPQYKQLGNSWAVNHARWVGWRIACWLAAQESQPVTAGNDSHIRAALLWALVA